MKKKMNRRDALQLGLGATLGTISAGLIGCKETKTEEATAINASQATENCTPTAKQTMGPFHPNQPQKDVDLDLTLFNGSPERAKGDLIYVSGRVTDENCQPIANAVVMIWQANAVGKYHHEYDHNDAPDDPNFQGWGQVKTNAKGEYSFKTIKPGAYPVDPESGRMRTPHIHYKVSKRGYHELITQMYFAGEALNKTDLLLTELSAAEKGQLVCDLEKGTAKMEAEARLVTFDITLKAVKKKATTALADYVGEYAITLGAPEFDKELEGTYGGKREDLILTIVQENDLLLAAMPIQPKSEIALKSKDRYAYDAFEAEIEFIRNDAGQVTELTLHRYYDFPKLMAKRI
ncbi:MAG: hypothetical protein AB8G22_27760 [Saprospiraceae bacterium]